MLPSIIAILIIFVLFLGAFSGGEGFGDTIRKGVRSLITLIVLLLLTYIVFENWEAIQRWLEDLNQLNP